MSYSHRVLGAAGCVFVALVFVADHPVLAGTTAGAHSTSTPAEFYATSQSSDEGGAYESWSRVDLLLAAGLSFPVAPDLFKDEWDPQFTASAGLAFFESMQLALVVNGSFSKFNRAHSTDVSSIYLSAGARGYLRTAVTLYLEGGLGFFHLGAESTEENALGAHALGGLQYSVVLVEAAYIHGFTDVESTAYLSVRAGLAFQVGGKN